MKKLMIGAFITAAMATFSGTASAKHPPRKGGYCISNSFMGSKSIFQCEYLGRVTIRQIYQKGWQVILKKDIKDTAAVSELIIEEQR